jgi:replicative DNA helicase
MGEAPGYAITVTELSSIVSNDINASHYANIIIQKYINREAIRRTNEIQDLAYMDDMDEVISLSTAMGDELLNNLPTANVATITEIFAANSRGIDERAAGGRGSYIDFGIRAIDRLLGGAEEGALVVIGGRPGAGKTSFAMQLAYNVSLIHPILYFTLEMTREELGLRYLVMLTDIDSNRLKRAEGITMTEWQLIEKAGRKLEERKIIIDDSARLSIYNIRSKVYRMVRSQGVKMVFIDYLQLMDGAKGKEGSEYYGSISRTCKQLAKELKIVIVLLSQLNRDIERRKEFIPRLSDLRASGEIEQDANVVMFPVSCKWAEINDPSKGLVPGKAIISIPKNRNGATGTAIINVSDNFMQWSDVDDYIAPKECVPPPFQVDG